jgi:hypothetical protein
MLKKFRGDTALALVTLGIGAVTFICGSSLFLDTYQDETLRAFQGPMLFYAGMISVGGLIFIGIGIGMLKPTKI